ncbi:MAG: UbiA prenyltransferase family protein [Leptonema sp. (in: bacteria)]
MYLKFKLYLKLIRIYQWTKNGFVILPFFFSNEAIEVFRNPFTQASLSIMIRLFIAFFSFSFIASSIYILNDYKDRELDKLDAKKRNRPLANGSVTSYEAFFLFFILFFLSLLLSSLLNLISLGLILFYFFMNLFYSFLGKKIVLLDVFLISLGFVIRVLFGSFSISIPASPWLITTTFFIALFLGFYKRLFETKNSPKEILMGGPYRKEFLKSFIDISASLAIINYSLYTILGTHANANLYWTIPFVVMGIFRYYTLLENPDNQEGNPSDVLLSDPFLAIIILSWTIACMSLILYFRN